MEIERKFLVDVPKKTLYTIIAGMESVMMVQGYLIDYKHRTLRVRIEGSRGVLTYKGPKSEDGTTCVEIETRIPLWLANKLMARVAKPLRKVRNYHPYKGHTWEIDVYMNESLSDLVVAEVELKSADEHVEIPEWIGKEVTKDSSYANSTLARGL